MGLYYSNPHVPLRDFSFYFQAVSSSCSSWSSPKGNKSEANPLKLPELSKMVPISTLAALKQNLQWPLAQDHLQ